MVEFSENFNQEESVRWDTITIVQLIIGKLCPPKFQSSLYNSILDYRSKKTAKTAYWDYALFSTMFKLMSKKRYLSKMNVK